jgi:hypothetical protein
MGMAVPNDLLATRRYLESSDVEMYPYGKKWRQKHLHPVTAAMEFGGDGRV